MSVSIQKNGVVSESGDSSDTGYVDTNDLRHAFVEDGEIASIRKDHMLSTEFIEM